MSLSMTQVTRERSELIAVRLYDAPRELVFRVWSDADHLAKWWGPQGFTLTTSAFDFRPGGEWRYVMHGPDGTDYDNRITYRAIEPPERLVYSHGDGDDEEQFRVTVTFDDRNGKTKLTMRSAFKTAEALQYVVEHYGAVEGAKSTLERLAGLLDGMSGDMR